MNENLLNESTIRKDLAKSLNDKNVNIRLIVEKLLSKSVSDDYMSRIVDTIIDDVIDDVNETADPEEWNDDDIRLAIGRAILKKFGEEF